MTLAYAGCRLSEALVCTPEVLRACTAVMLAFAPDHALRRRFSLPTGMQALRKGVHTFITA